MRSPRFSVSSYCTKWRIQGCKRQDAKKFNSCLKLTDSFCICRNIISCAHRKRSLHSKWNSLSYTTSNADQWKWPERRISAEPFRVRSKRQQSCNKSTLKVNFIVYGQKTATWMITIQFVSFHTWIFTVIQHISHLKQLNLTYTSKNRSPGKFDGASGIIRQNSESCSMYFIRYSIPQCINYAKLFLPAWCMRRYEFECSPRGYPTLPNAVNVPAFSTPSPNNISPHSCTSFQHNVSWGSTLWHVRTLCILTKSLSNYSLKYTYLRNEHCGICMWLRRRTDCFCLRIDFAPFQLCSANMLSCVWQAYSIRKQRGTHYQIPRCGNYITWKDLCKRKTREREHTVARVRRIDRFSGFGRARFQIAAWTFTAMKKGIPAIRVCVHTTTRTNWSWRNALDSGSKSSLT